MKYLLLFFLGLTLLYGCKDGKHETPPGTEDTGYVDITELPDSLKYRNHPDTLLAAANKDSVLKGLTKQVLTLIKQKNYKALDGFIHDEKGIRLSPYAFVSSSDKKFSRAQFLDLFGKNKSKKYTWGTYDGTGDPIVLTAPEYFSKFVYDANFLHPEKLEVNRSVGAGNTTNNIKEFYNQEDFTESYFSNSKKTDGLPWKSVRLVFKEINGKYYLVGIVHDQWTI